MYERREDRTRRIAAETELLVYEERMKVENALRDPRYEEHHTVERVREETRGFAAHESNAYGIAAKQNHDLFSSFNGANTKNAELEHILQ